MHVNNRFCGSDELVRLSETWLSTADTRLVGLGIQCTKICIKAVVYIQDVVTLDLLQNCSISIL